MKLTKCVNGHFYDEEKFESCPHCAGGSKLDVNEIFGGAPSAPKPAMTKVERDDDMTVPLEWTPADTPAAAPVAEEKVEPAQPEEKALEAEMDIHSQPSFDTPLDFNADFAGVSSEEKEEEPEAKTEEAVPQTEEPEFELLSKFSSAEKPEMPQPNVEEITEEDHPVAAAPIDPELEDKPTEIVEEAEVALVNGLLSEEEMSDQTAPEVPGSAAQATEAADKIPAEPSITPNPVVTPEPVATPEPVVTPEPIVSPEPVVAPSPVSAAFSTPDEDDDEHTVAFYDEVFTAVSKTATEPPVHVNSAPETSTKTSVQASAAPEAPAQAPVQTSAAPEMPAQAPVQASAAPETPVQTAQAETTAGPAEPNVFTAPPLQKVQTLPTPCVGWLIALNGVHIGQDFHLRVGKNYIGRDESMDVALVGDKSVSRNKHAIVIYEPRHHKYFIQPGESNELVYVNDEVVLLPMELKPYDLIVIGDIELWFMPLCDADHNWSEVIRKLQEQMQQS